MSDQLLLDNNFSNADAFYAALTDIHRDLTPEQSERVNVRLVLLLANQVGNLNILQDILAIAADLGENHD